MKINKKYLMFLIAYAFCQLMTLFYALSAILFIYVLSFGLALGTGIRNIYQVKSFGPVKTNILLSFIVNLILTIIYIPTVLLPIINHSNGLEQADPMVLIVGFPTVFFIISVIVFLVVGLFVKILKKN